MICQKLSAHVNSQRWKPPAVENLSLPAWLSPPHHFLVLFSAHAGAGGDRGSCAEAGQSSERQQRRRRRLHRRQQTHGAWRRHRLRRRRRRRLAARVRRRGGRQRLQLPGSGCNGHKQRASCLRRHAAAYLGRMPQASRSRLPRPHASVACLRLARRQLRAKPHDACPGPSAPPCHAVTPAACAVPVLDAASAPETGHSPAA